MRWFSTCIYKGVYHRRYITTVQQQQQTCTNKRECNSHQDFTIITVYALHTFQGKHLLLQLYFVKKKKKNYILFFYSNATSYEVNGNTCRKTAHLHFIASHTVLRVEKNKRGGSPTFSIVRSRAVTMNCGPWEWNAMGPLPLSCGKRGEPNSCRQTWLSLLKLYCLLPHEVPLIYENIRVRPLPSSRLNLFAPYAP